MSTCLLLSALIVEWGTFLLHQTVDAFIQLILSCVSKIELYSVIPACCKPRLCPIYWFICSSYFLYLHSHLPCRTAQVMLQPKGLCPQTFFGHVLLFLCPTLFTGSYPHLNIHIHLLKSLLNDEFLSVKLFWLVMRIFWLKASPSKLYRLQFINTGNFQAKYGRSSRIDVTGYRTPTNCELFCHCRYCTLSSCAPHFSRQCLINIPLILQ